MGTDKVRVLRNDGTRVPIRDRDSVAVWCSVAERKIERVDGVVPRRDEAPRETPRQHRIEEESHAAGGWMRLIWASRVAKAKVARTSSRSRSS